MFHFPRLRSPLGIAAIVALTAGTTAAGAATAHRFVVTQSAGSGSEDATTFLQTSTTSSALQGEVAASPRTTLTIPFGVLGEYDAAGTTFGIGVAGISTTGYAVGAEALGSNPAVLAEGAGTGVAFEAVGKSNDGIDSFTDVDQGFGVYGEDDSPDQNGIGAVGLTEGTGFGTAGVNLGGGAGVFGLSEAGTSGAPSIEAASDTPGTELFDGQVTGSDSNEYEVASLTYPSADASGYVLNTGTGGNADLQLNGDIILTGALYSGCPNYPETNPGGDCDAVVDSVSRSNNGNLVRAYGARNAAPTMEDAGEARMINGYAHVTLDPTFAASISTKQPYLVFPAPQADSRGLFVTNRTASGFDVRENAGGRSNLTFDYRIVAKPFAADSKRMAFVAPHRATAVGMLSKRVASRGSHFKAMYQKRRLLGHPKSLVNFTGMQTLR